MVIPSKSRLTLNLSEEENRPSQVSAYTFDANHAARVDRERMEGRAAEGKDADIQGQQKLLKEQAMRDYEKNGGRGGKDGTGRGGKAGGGNEQDANVKRKRAMEDNALRARGNRGGGVDHRPIARSPLFEPGWRPVGTARFDADGVAVLENLPGNEDIRFLFVRGRERITTSSSSRLKPFVRSIGTVDLPRPLPDSGEAPRSDAASVRIQLDKDSAGEKLAESVEWTVE